MNFWILKTEPHTYSLSDLERDKLCVWDGVRNFQARNNLRLMSVADQVMIYHSVGPREIVGLAAVTKTAFKDPTAKEGDWSAVEIEFIRRFPRPLSLASIKANAQLSELSLVKQSRLSVIHVLAKEWQILLKLVDSK